MYVSSPRENKDGSTSCVFKCNIKGQQYTKTFRLPPDIKGKKVFDKWKTETARVWREELERGGAEFTAPQNNDILFIDFARQYNEELLLRNPTGYAHYNSNLGHIKTIEPKLGKYKLAAITPIVLNNFFNYLMTRRYEKIAIMAKPALLALINEKHITLQSIAEACKIAQTTLFAALHDKHVNETTATKICDYLQIPLKEYFTIEKERRPYSYSANNGVKVFIHGVLQHAVRLGLIERNSASKDYVLPISGTKGKKEILESLDECKYFIERVNAQTDLRKKAAFALYLYLGLRNAEVCGLSWENIDFEKGIISIVQNTVYLGKRFGTITKEPKTEMSKRTIGMPKALADILREYKAWWKIEKEHHGDLWAHTDKLFVTNTGKDMSGGTLADWLKKFEEKNGIKNVTPHGLRHTAVTVMIANGVDIKTVSARVGHSDVQTTLNIYSHYTKEADRQAADTIDRLLKV